MKIIQVINAMIIKQEKISSVLKVGNEYFFLYNNIHKWSIVKSTDENYFLHFYPTNDMTLDQLSRYQNWTDYSGIITYNSSDLKTQEASESFRELYQIVAEKVFGLDDIFDEIINS